jgi:prolipoprotein diacylglyceryl transferase
VTTFTASFPSPPQGVWHLGFLPIRAYALFIIAGIIVALVLGDRRWVARGGEPGVIYDIALWAVPFGLIGGRLYHVMTDWKTYFGDGGAGFIAALKIWDGGLGIWGAVALGGLGAWIGCRQRGIPLPAFGDAIAPGIVLAQAIGRLGNYFNQELYGRPTTMPWGMKIYERRDASGVIDYLNGVSTGHVEKVVQPTFLYELIWNVLVFVLLIYVDRRLKLGHGRLFALYVATYCVGRFCVELLRDDTATHIAGIRINSFTSVFIFIGAVVYIILAPKGREDPATLVGKPREPKEREPQPAKAKEEALQEVKSGEDSALVEWTKELAAVAATSGVVAGVAVAAEHDEKDKSGGDRDTAEPVEARKEDVAEPEQAPEPEAEVVKKGEPEAETEETPEADAEAEAEVEAAEGPEAAAAEVGEPEPEPEEAPQAAAEAAAGEAEAAEEEVPQAEAEETPEAEAEVEAPEAPKAEAEEVGEPEPEAEEAPQAAAKAAAGEAEAEAEEGPQAEAEQTPDAEGEETPEPEAEEGPEAEETPEAEPAEAAEPEVATERVIEESIAKLEPTDEEPTDEEVEESTEAEESADEPEAADGHASACVDTQERTDQEHTDSVGTIRNGETADTHAPQTNDGPSEAAGTARRRWRLPRFGSRAK